MKSHFLKKTTTLVLGLLAVVYSSHVYGDYDEVRRDVARCRTVTEGQVELQAAVNRVVDGDTVNILVEGEGISVRLLSIDTAETHYQGKSQGYWGEEAANRLKKLLPVGTSVRVEFEHDRCDMYGRILGHIWKGDTNMNRKMIEEALAVNYCIVPNTNHCEEYGDITDQNIVEASGIFGDPDFVLPYEWRRIVSNRPYEKYLGNLDTHEVYPPRPDTLDRVPVGLRVFFFKKSDIKLPYHLVEDDDSSDVTTN